MVVHRAHRSGHNHPHRKSTTGTEKSMPLGPIAGVLLLLGGASLLVAGTLISAEAWAAPIREVRWTVLAVQGIVASASPLMTCSP